MISDLKDQGLLNRTSYLNFFYISIVTFGLSSILKNLRKRILVCLSRDKKPYLSYLILAIVVITSDLYRSYIRTFIVEEEDVVVLRDIKMRIGRVVENKAINKVIGV